MNIEQMIEARIDRFLEDMAPGLYGVQILTGAIFILLGGLLLLRKTTFENQKLYGGICLVIGLTACISGLVQGGYLYSL